MADSQHKDRAVAQWPRWVVVAPLCLTILAFLAGIPAQPAQAREDRETHGAARSAGAAAVAGEEDAVESEELSAVRKALYKAVNTARANAGARRLERDEGFEAIVRDHARDMVDRQYMAHVSPDGEGPRDRMIARFPDFTGIAGENIAMRTIRPDERPRDTAQAAVEAWLDSPPHRKNLLDQRHGYAGIAAADNGQALYIVMLLASEPSLRPPEPEPEPEPALGAGTDAPENPPENSVSDAPGA